MAKMGRAPQRRVAVGDVPLLLLISIVLFCHAMAYDGYAEGASGMTDLQKHVSFFDSNGDGIISINETYKGFRVLGFGVAMSTASATFINGALASKTRSENAMSSPLDIYIENIQKVIHGSDSGTYNAQGRFVPENFDEIFTNYAKTVPDALTSDNIDELLRADRKPGDYQGWLASTTEWKILYDLAKDKDGLLHKDVLRGVYDGSLFQHFAQERKGYGDKWEPININFTQ